ncbi:MAG: DUF2079 domain-containing protein [Kineosporiaceae bacterium]
MGEDLTLFTQGVDGLSRGGTPLAAAKADGFNLFGDHFHPVVALIAPFYRLWPSPVTLLVAQALAVALGAGVLSRAAFRHLEPLPATALSAAFALCWPLQTMSVYGFHEIAFAVPLLALSLSSLLDRRFVACALWALPLLLVKEDQALTVAVLGAVLWTRGRRRLGAGVGVAGLAGFALITGVVIPSLSYYGRFTYWSAGVGESDTSTASPGVVTGLALHVWTSLSSPTPWMTGALLLVMVAGLALRSSLLLLALPAAAIRLVSSNEGMWSWHYHYDAPLAVILFFAALEVMRDRQHTLLRRAPVVLLAVAVALVPFFPLGGALSGAATRCGTCADATAILALVPDGADVAADVYLSPHLATRTTTRLLLPGFTDSAGHPLRSDYAVLNSRRREAEDLDGILTSRGLRVVTERGPYRLYRRD